MNLKSPQKSPLPALKSLDENGSVVYVGSFSKSLFPGLRLGCIVASSAFVKGARALRLGLRIPDISSGQQPIFCRSGTMTPKSTGWERPTAIAELK